jgi:hypothetical protein
VNSYRHLLFKKSFVLLKYIDVFKWGECVHLCVTLNLSCTEKYHQTLEHIESSRIIAFCTKTIVLGNKQVNIFRNMCGEPPFLIILTVPVCSTYFQGQSNPCFFVKMIDAYSIFLYRSLLGNYWTFHPLDTQHLQVRIITMTKSIHKLTSHKGPLYSNGWIVLALAMAYLINDRYVQTQSMLRHWECTINILNKYNVCN